MSDEYVYCHGTNCHKKHTQDRIRGVKGSKVLRTKKIKLYNRSNFMYQYFCSQSCYDDFANHNIEQIIAIAPRTEPLETPIEVQRIKHPETTHNNGSGYSWTQREWTETRIKECDNIDNGS
jgi:YHS domain-containing protein